MNSCIHSKGTKHVPLRVSILFTKEGCWECDFEYMEENCLSYFLSNKWYNEVLINKVASWHVFQATTVSRNPIGPFIATKIAAEFL